MISLRQFSQKLETIFASKAHVRVIEFFLLNSGEIINLSSIARLTKLSTSTVHRVVSKLVDLGILKEIRIGTQVRAFYLNSGSKIVKALKEFYDQI